MKVYKVVAVGGGGLRDVIAEFSSRERAERFVEQVKAIDKDAKLEIVEAREAYPQPFKVLLALAVLVVELTILMQMVRAVSRGGGSVV